MRACAGSSWRRHDSLCVCGRAWFHCPDMQIPCVRIKRTGRLGVISLETFYGYLIFHGFLYTHQKVNTFLVGMHVSLVKLIKSRQLLNQVTVASFFTLPVHYILINISFDAIYTKLLIAAATKP